MATRKIKMFTTISGSHGVCCAGQTWTVEEDYAKSLVDAGYAEYVDIPIPEKKESESASIEAPENAMMPKAKKKIFGKGK